MAAGFAITMEPRPLGAMAAGIEPVGQGDSEQCTVTPIATDPRGRLDCLIGQHALIGDDHPVLRGDTPEGVATRRKHAS